MGSWKPSLKSNDKTGMLMAYTDEWKEIEAVYQVVLEMTMAPSGRKGIVRLAVTSYKADEGHTGIPQAHYSCEFPSAAVESFEACLYRCLIKIERIIRDKRAYPNGKG
jgi:hypothetical protein